MKYIIAFAIAASSVHAISAQSRVMHPFILEGRIRGRDTGYVYLNYRPAGDRGITDSCRLVKGHFIIEGSIVEPTRAFLSTWNGFDPSSRPDELNVTDFYIEPANMKLSAVIGQFQNRVLTGSETDRESKKLRKARAPMEAALLPIGNAFNVLAKKLADEKTAGSDPVRLNILEKSIDSLKALDAGLQREERLIDSAFIMQNPDSYLAVEMLSHSVSEGIGFPSLEWVYSRCTKRIQESFPGQNVKYQIAKQKNIFPGAPAQNFIAVDHKNDTINLADYKGKRYVLLDFGASWCAPCRALIPMLRALYSKYDTAIEIISIAEQDEEEAWKKMVKDEHLPWPQILENGKHAAIGHAGNSISDSYYIVSNPTLILIDRKTQRIIGIFGGGSPLPGYAVRDELKKMFENN